jgi:hypothetical protein
MKTLRLLPFAVGLLPVAFAAEPATNPAQSPNPQPERLALRVEIYGPAGLHVVTNKTDVEASGDRYTIKADLETQGFAGFFVRIKSHAEVRGKLVGGSVRPESFHSDTVRNGAERHNKVAYADDGTVTGSSTPPSKEPLKPVTAAQMRGTVDNLTAYFLLERQLAKSGKCALDVPVFDGLERYNLHFTDDGREKLAPSSGQRFAGETIVCHMKREEIGGFPKDPKDSEGAREGRIWYGRLVPGDVLQAIRMEMDTEAGQISGYLAELHAKTQGKGVDLALME